MIYTEYELDELLSCSQSVEYFMDNVCIITHTTKGCVYANMLDHQRYLMDSIEHNDVTVIDHARQMGISTMFACRGLWEAIFKPNRNVLIFGLNIDMAKATLDKIRFIHEHFPDFLKPALVTDNKRLVKFDNGSTIRVSSIRSAMPLAIQQHIIFAEDFGFYHIPRGLQAIDYLSPLVTMGSKLVMGSSVGPASQKIFEKVEETFKHKNVIRHNIPWYMMERDDPDEFRDNTIETIGYMQWLQEYECSFQHVA